MEYLPALGFVLLGFGVVFLSIPLIRRAVARFETNRGWDWHHTHTAAVPRYGGLALALGFCITELVIFMVFPQRRAQVPGRNAIVFGSLAMFALGFIDDLRPLGAGKKLAAQVLISLAVACAGVGFRQFQIPFSDSWIQLGGFGIAVTVVWLVALTNLINLIDGVDGLAGGICLMLLLLLVHVGQTTGAFVLLTSGMTGATLAFLCFNFPPAKIYLGDGGAYFLGFQIGLFAIAGSREGSVAAAIISPLFVLALPILDTALTILRRTLYGLPLLRADRGHLHHRLLRMGMSHRRIVLSLYGLTLAFLGLGFAAFLSHDLIPILLGVAVLILWLCAARYGFTPGWLAIGRSLGTSLALRQEVQYAFCLAEWLKREGERCETLDQLWQDFTFAAGRLGFVSVRISLGTATREWRNARFQAVETLRCERFDLQHGRYGVLEFRFLGTDPTGRLQASPLETASELLAEAWVDGAKSFAHGRANSLSFARFRRGLDSGRRVSAPDRPQIDKEPDSHPALGGDEVYTPSPRRSEG